MLFLVSGSRVVFWFQVAMLFTSMTGQRRLRVHNLSLNSCSQMADLFKNVELDALVNFISKTGRQAHSHRRRCQARNKFEKI